MMKRVISRHVNIKALTIPCLIIFCIVLGMAGCRQQAQQPVQTPATQQPAQGETGANFVKITAPQPDDLVDGFLIVSGTYECPQDMALVLSLCTEDGQSLAFYNPYWAEGDTPKEMDFETALNFVPPTSADGYLNAFFVNRIGNTSPVMAYIPIKFAVRSTDPSAYPTACVTTDTGMLAQPGSKLNNVVSQGNVVNKGNAVTVLNSSNGWSQILIYLFEAGPNVGWVPSNVLSPDTSGITEGQLNTDVTPVPEPPSDGKPITAYGTNNVFAVKIGTPVIYHQKQNDWVDCLFPEAGYGWIPINDIDFVGPSVNSRPDSIHYN